METTPEDSAAKIKAGDGSILRGIDETVGASITHRQQSGVAESMGAGRRRRVAHVGEFIDRFGAAENRNPAPQKRRKAEGTHFRFVSSRS